MGGTFGTKMTTNPEFAAGLCSDDPDVVDPDETTTTTTTPPPSQGPCENFGSRWKCSGFSNNNVRLCGIAPGFQQCAKTECLSLCEAVGKAGCCQYYDELKTADPNACFYVDAA